MMTARLVSQLTDDCRAENLVGRGLARDTDAGRVQNTIRMRGGPREADAIVGLVTTPILLPMHARGYMYIRGKDVEEFVSIRILWLRQSLLPL